MDVILNGVMIFSVVGLVILALWIWINEGSDRRRKPEVNDGGGHRSCMGRGCEICQPQRFSEH